MFSPYPLFVRLQRLTIHPETNIQFPPEMRGWGSPENIFRSQTVTLKGSFNCKRGKLSPAEDSRDEA
jgi:hypothetical protein